MIRYIMMFILYFEIIIQIGYVAAFLATIRTKLLPYHSKSMKNYPSKDELDSIYKETYK